MTDSDILVRMRSHVEHCRRLARQTTDEETARSLRHLAEEGDSDIARMASELVMNRASGPFSRYR